MSSYMCVTVKMTMNMGRNAGRHVSQTSIYEKEENLPACLCSCMLHLLLCIFCLSLCLSPLLCAATPAILPHCLPIPLTCHAACLPLFYATYYLGGTLLCYTCHKKKKMRGLEQKNRTGKNKDRDGRTRKDQWIVLKHAHTCTHTASCTHFSLLHIPYTAHAVAIVTLCVPFLLPACLPAPCLPCLSCHFPAIPASSFLDFSHLLLFVYLFCFSACQQAHAPLCCTLFSTYHLLHTHLPPATTTSPASFLLHFSLLAFCVFCRDRTCRACATPQPPTSPCFCRLPATMPCRLHTCHPLPLPAPHNLLFLT